ncbi:MAG: Ig-like domain-containing protein, partial [Candidatus Muiribacteriota bacterium]
SPERIFETTMPSLGKPVLTKSGDNIFIYWTGESSEDSYKKVYYAFSTDNGETFSAHKILFPADEPETQFMAQEVSVASNSTDIGVSIIAVKPGSPIESDVLFISDNFSAMQGKTKLSLAEFNILTEDIDSSESYISNLNIKAGTNEDFNIIFDRELNDISRIFYWNSSMGAEDASEIPLTYQDLTDSTSFKAQPFLHLNGNDVNIIFNEFVPGTNNKLVFIISYDGGNEWETLEVVEGRLDSSLGWPCLNEFSQNLYALWIEGASEYNINYKTRETNGWDYQSYILSLENDLDDIKNISFESGDDRLFYLYTGVSGSKDLYFGFSSLATDEDDEDFPKVINRFPEPGSEDNPRKIGVRVEFSEEMNTDTFNLNNLKFTESGINVPADLEVQSSTIVLIKPTSTLNENTEFTVSVSGVLSLTGKQVVPATWEFKTGAQDTSSTGEITRTITYPNPFRGGVFRFNYDFSRPAQSVQISIFDMQGRVINRLNASDTGGVSSDLIWDLMDRRGNRVGNGVYIYRISADFGDKKQTKDGRFIIAE